MKAFALHCMIVITQQFQVTLDEEKLSIFPHSLRSK
jgi:hypothetical protein